MDRHHDSVKEEAFRKCVPSAAGETAGSQSLLLAFENAEDHVPYFGREVFGVWHSGQGDRAPGHMRLPHGWHAIRESKRGINGRRRALRYSILHLLVNRPVHGAEGAMIPIQVSDEWPS